MRSQVRPATGVPDHRAANSEKEATMTKQANDFRGRIFSREDIFARGYFREKIFSREDIFAGRIFRENISNSLFAKFSSRENKVLGYTVHYRSTSGRVVCRRRRLSIHCAIRRWPSFDSRQKAVLQSNNKTRQEKPKLERNRAKKLLNIRMTNQENITSFKQELAKQTWENVYQAENVHEAYHVFMTKMVKLYNATCPLKRSHVRARNKYKPWITTGLNKMPVVLKFLRTRNYETETRYKTYKTN